MLVILDENQSSLGLLPFQKDTTIVRVVLYPWMFLITNNTPVAESYNEIYISIILGIFT